MNREQKPKKWKILFAYTASCPLGTSSAWWSLSQSSCSELKHLITELVWQNTRSENCSHKRNQSYLYRAYFRSNNNFRHVSWWWEISWNCFSRIQHLASLKVFKMRWYLGHFQLSLWRELLLLVHDQGMHGLVWFQGQAWNGNRF